MEPHPKFSHELVFELTEDLSKELAKNLEHVFTLPECVTSLASQSGQNYRLYWKLIEGDSRCLLAHPEPQDWVGTIALEKTAFEKFLVALREHRPFALQSVAPLSRLSNFHLRFENLPT